MHGQTPPQVTMHAEGHEDTPHTNPPTQTEAKHRTALEKGLQRSQANSKPKANPCGMQESQNNPPGHPPAPTSTYAHTHTRAHRHDPATTPRTDAGEHGRMHTL